MRKHPHHRSQHFVLFPLCGTKDYGKRDTDTDGDRDRDTDTSLSGAEWRINTAQLLRTASVGGPCCSRFPFPSRCVREVKV
ncbi:hypothetical protein M5D96_008160 [Drosophila gunungcola]|uniref:Uncharacterized protein n=1 Tax=Drosophila gunungcola TaxID=103775 RepID=A0A9P9YM44_9MUSC|nr:hypothetical protein M5D96_008160 [Drosophila gunungcola]